MPELERVCRFDKAQFTVEGGRLEDFKRVGQGGGTHTIISGAVGGGAAVCKCKKHKAEQQPAHRVVLLPFPLFCFLTILLGTSNADDGK
jgi:hypothetical protein